MKQFCCAAALASALLASCIKDEPLNMECDVLSAWVEGGAASFYKPADMMIERVTATERTLTFTVRSLATLPDLALHFTLTPGATVSPANGSLQNFREGPVTYTVTSEDGQWHKTYDVRFTERRGDDGTAATSTTRYDFEHFERHERYGYYQWFELDGDQRTDCWASGNEGFYIAKPAADAADYPTVAATDGYEGSAVRLTTRDTGTWGRRFGKPIAAGNLFLGRFDSHYAMTNTLLTTEMGVAVAREPLRVRGYYKYCAGEKFTDKNFQEVAGRVDEPDIYAVFYVNTDDEGKAVMLHGDDVKTNAHIVRSAGVAALPPTDEWAPFEMTFQGTTPIDRQRLQGLGYNLALVFTSSKTGASFEGSVGSTLYIDKVEIEFKNDEQD